MNTFNFLNDIYGKLGTYKYLPFWFFTPLRIIVRNIANWYFPKYLTPKKIIQNNREKDLIVSLTSFPARINDVWMVIECLKRQTVLPEKIMLWLSKDQFPSNDSIPEKLVQEQDDLFSIVMVDGDIRSHKKYYYAVKYYSEKSFITCDDDIFYDNRMIERLLKTSKLYPKCIIANKTSQMVFAKNGVSPYKNWYDNKTPFSHVDLIQIGLCGVFYPAGCLHSMVTNDVLFMKLAPYADDIWLNAMARLKGTPVVQSSEIRYPLEIVSESPSLTDINNGENKNDLQIEQIRNYLLNNDFDDVYFKSLFDNM